MDEYKKHEAKWKKANIKKYIFLSSWVQSGEQKNHTMIL